MTCCKCNRPIKIDFGACRIDNGGENYGYVCTFCFGKEVGWCAGINWDHKKGNPFLALIVNKRFKTALKKKDK